MVRNQSRIKYTLKEWNPKKEKIGWRRAKLRLQLKKKEELDLRRGIGMKKVFQLKSSPFIPNYLELSHSCKPRLNDNAVSKFTQAFPHKREKIVKWCLLSCKSNSHVWVSTFECISYVPLVLFCWICLLFSTIKTFLCLCVSFNTACQINLKK